jgi:hypothetical protein
VFYSLLIFCKAKVHLKLAQTFYIQRMQELKDAIETQESKFQYVSDDELSTDFENAHD